MICNAVIIGDQTPPEKYDTETEQRGSPKLVVRAHILAEILRNAQRWVRGYQSPESKSLKFGELLDCLLLTPFQWPKRFAVVPADAPKKPSKTQLNAKKPSPETVAAIEWWAGFQRENPGEIVSPDLNGSVHAAIARLREDEMLSELIDTSGHQVMIVAEWHDEPTRLIVPLKCLIDVVPPNDHPIFSNSLWDVKTTANASERSFMKDAQKYSYHVQGAFYLDMWNAATKQNRSDFGHIVLENYPPYEYRTPPPLLSQRFLNHGRLTYQRALGIYCKALATGDWPSYDKKPGDWPITDCEDWFLSAESLYDEIEEPELEEAEPVPADDLVP